MADFIVDISPAVAVVLPLVPVTNTMKFARPGFSSRLAHAFFSLRLWHVFTGLPACDTGLVAG